MTKKTKQTKKITPLMQQYFKIKSEHPGAILLFRVGDFYETFGEDAVTISKVLGIILTSRNNGGSNIELAGFPYHSLDLYLPRLVKAGFRVAICEQLEKPSKEKKIVKRGVTELVTPGLTTNDKILDFRDHNYLCAIHKSEKEEWGISFLELSTGEFLVAEGDSMQIRKLVKTFSPSEFVFCRNIKEEFEANFGGDRYYYLLDEWMFDQDNARDQVLRHFKVNSLKGFGLDNLDKGIVAAGVTLQYLDVTLNRKTEHISSIKRINHDEFVWMDEFTISNLELVRPQHSTGISLLEVIDHTKTSMGARLLKTWMLLPLLSKESINARLNKVELLVQETELSNEILTRLAKISDVERMVSKLALLKINPREIDQLYLSLSVIREIKEILLASEQGELEQFGQLINSCDRIISDIEKTVKREPPVNISKGDAIQSGVNADLDELRDLISNSKEHLLALQTEESRKTGIDKLKVGYNQVFGYYFEVTNKYKGLGLVPDHWVRKQTLTNSERYISDELKVLEEKILGAEEKVLSLENQLFSELLSRVKLGIPDMQRNSQLIAQLDCLQSYRHMAVQFDYHKPEILDNDILELKKSRHPVIEQHLGVDQSFVPNDVYLSPEEQQIILLTGPNMAGKSALLRQVALNVILAQMGSFVPSESAKIGIVDKIFTRVGASDNISSGESTFMVEMHETASILNNISQRSLILLDEIGRGTSTYDGISIAWAIAEFLHENPIAHPKTLFATHYHEMNELEAKFERIKNYTIDTRVQGRELIFLRKFIPGASEHSFGILVAKMAGMPMEVVKRGEEILQLLEDEKKKGLAKDEIKDKLKSIEAPVQMNLFQLEDEDLLKLKTELQSLDLNKTTPVECMMKIVEWQKLLKE